jgi:hypothetical protein
LAFAGTHLHIHLRVVSDCPLLLFQSLVKLLPDCTERPGANAWDVGEVFVCHAAYLAEGGDAVELQRLYGAIGQT